MTVFRERVSWVKVRVVDGSGLNPGDNWGVSSGVGGTSRTTSRKGFDTWWESGFASVDRDFKRLELLFFSGDTQQSETMSDPVVCSQGPEPAEEILSFISTVYRTRFSRVVFGSFKT